MILTVAMLRLYAKRQIQNLSKGGFIMKAINIDWDVDHIEELETLPKEIIIPDGIEDLEDISDYISDKTGFCHLGFDIE